MLDFELETPRTMGRVRAHSLFSARSRVITLALCCALLTGSLTFFGIGSANAAAGTITNGSCSSVVGETSTASIVQSGTDCILTFTSGANSWTPPTNVTAVRVLVVGGGAGGDRGVCSVYWGHGGGGGQVKDLYLPVTPGTSNSITVGGGGAGSGSCSSGSGGNGGNSVLAAITSGGGYAANYNSAVGGHSGSYINAGATGTGTYGAGGGAGAGEDASTINGGAGIDSDISGTTYMYGSGGAGKNDAGYGTKWSGGGDGSTLPIANRGGGGSDAYPSASGSAGAAGVVIVRYTNPAACNPISGTDGTATTLKFNTVGTCTWSVPAGVNSVRVLLVGGGGGGGSWVGGGGGGGGVIDIAGVAVTPGSSQPISVGVGGYGALKTHVSGAISGTNGSSSSALGYTAYGGGFGASWTTYTTGSLATGGGSAHNTSSAAGYYATALASISPWQGYAGGIGTGDWSLGYASGGGGGAGGVGQNNSGGQSGAGGVGRYSKITGTGTYYGGGGGGGCHGAGTTTCSFGSGTHGGGTGSGWTGIDYITATGASGTANTGGGGGGSGGPGGNPYFNSQGGAGGSGTVIIRYESKAPSAPTSVAVTTGRAQLGVTWAAPTNLNNSAITGYQVEYSTTGTGTWTVASSAIASNATSYTITGLGTNVSYYVRVAALYSGGVGTYGYPWTKIYSTSTPYRSSGSITYDSGFGLSGGAAATNASTAFSRIRYRMQSTYDGVAKYVDADFNRTFATTSSSSTTYDSITKLQVPSTTGAAANQFILQGNVSDLNILSNAAEIQTGKGLSGRVEIWPWNYTSTTASDQAERSSGTFDDSDTPAGSGDYGSFQLHNLTAGNKETVFAWNYHASTSGYGIGFGNYIGPQSDWTFCSTEGPLCGGRSGFNLASYINAPTSTETDTTITNVTSSTADGKKSVGTAVSIQVSFSRAVTVNTSSGTPTLELETGATNRTATYASGSGTTSLTFSYTVSTGDVAADLDYASTTALALNGGTIKDSSSYDAILTLVAPGATGSLGANKALVVDGIAPTVTSVTIPAKADGSYTTGTNIEVWVNFSETVDANAVTNLRLLLETGATDRYATYLRGDPDVSYVFGYTVQAGDATSDLDYLSVTSLDVGTNLLKDLAGNLLDTTLPTPGATGSIGASKNIVIDTVAPTVTSVTSSKADGTYLLGEVIPIAVNFSEAVTVTGTPTLSVALNIAGTSTSRAISYSSGSGTSTLIFNYTVASTEETADLNYYATTSLALAGGTIKDAATNVATLTLPALASASSLGGSKAIVIDAWSPVYSSAAVSTDGRKIVLTYNETLNSTTAASSAFTITVASTSATITSVAVSGSTIELTMARRITVSQAVTLAYADPTSGNDANAIQDIAGNDAAAKTSGSITNNSTITVPVITAPTSGLSAIAMTSYSLTFNAATSGLAPYTYTTSTLPAGLTLSGRTISGLPTTAGTFSGIQITVTDANDVTATSSAFTIVVNPGRQSTLYITTTSGTIGQTLTLRTSGGGGNGAVTYTSRAVAGTTCSLSGSSLTATTASGSYGICYITATKAADSAFTTARTSAETLIYFAAYIPVITQSTTCPSGTAPSAPTGITASSCQPIAPVSPLAGNSSAAPKITSLSVTTGAVGTSVTITGTGFSGVTKVQFGSKSTTTFSATSTTISVSVPTGATTGRVMVFSPTGTAMASQIFTVPVVPDTTAPSVVSAAIDQITPTQLVITYSESLAASGIAAGAFAVQVASVNRTVSSVAISGTTVTLTLASAPTSGQAVSFTYTSPGDSTSIQDAAGNKAPTWTSSSVTGI